MLRSFLRAAAGAALLSIATPAPAAVPSRLEDGLSLALPGGTLRVQVCAADLVRVAFAADAGFFGRKTMMAEPRRCEKTAFTLATTAKDATLATSRLKVRVDLGTGAVAFLDATGKPVLAEKPGGRTLTSATVQDEKTRHVRQEWLANNAESLYGLGQHQHGLLDIKGYDIDLWQHNVVVAVPFLASSQGYGILWDNDSYTRFGDLRKAELVPTAVLRDAEGSPGGLTGSYYAGAKFERLVAKRKDAAIDIEIPGGTKDSNLRIHPDLPAEGEASVRWEGTIEPAATGDHVFQPYSNNGIKLWIDDRLVIDHWRQGWLPWTDLARVRLEKGRRHRVRLEWTKEQGIETLRFLWKTPAPSDATSLWSEVGDGIDYYFCYGPGLDQVVAGYRRVTGQAPMMPVWAFGFWQSRERYQTAQESLDVLAGFRSRKIPIDNIVQDWQYWKPDAWGSHQFDPARFPDPAGWAREIHDKWKARLMISVWGKFYPGTANYDALKAGGFLFDAGLKEGMIDWLGKPFTFLDAYSTEGRRLFWAQMERDLLSKGVDSWWMDATEPDLVQPMPTLDGQKKYAHPTAMGTGSRVLNAYSLLTSQAVYDGQRAAKPGQRVFILTRSGFAGQQRYAATTWSGDISSTWTAFRKQIPAGLSFSLSGIPYWTLDVGGFSVPGRFAKNPQSPEDAEEWRELNTRWFQYGTFLPILRAHGQSPHREMWTMGGESSPTYETQLKFDRLRYRLLPYVYSLAGAVAHDAGTMLRPLVMDFRDDPRSRDVVDQYLFGPAFLVSPVTHYKARSRSVYLPAGAGWYDFWTGTAAGGGQAVDAPAPFDQMPVHVRAGAIVPFGPELQYTGEKPADPVTLFVYTGADGRFSLYEDDGLTYGYEKGAFSRIPLRWDEAARTLHIGAREGSFPGMLAERSFEVVFVGKDKVVPFSFTPRADKTVAYRGQAVAVKAE